MVTTTAENGVPPLHPLHAMLLAFPLPLFLGALLSDWAYSSTYQVQWINFASWLNAGALVFSGLALLWSLIDALRADNRRGRSKWVLVGLLVATLAVGLVTALIHAKDAWASMPAGLILSIITLLLAIVSAGTGFSSRRMGEPQ